MEPIPEHVSQQITVKQAVLLACTILGAVGGSLVWVGSIEARVNSLEHDGSKVADKINQIAEDTSYLRGVIDADRKRAKK